MCVLYSGEWFEVARGRVVGEDLWTHGLEDIWRGNLHFTEQRVSMYSGTSDKGSSEIGTTSLQRTLVSTPC